MTDGTRNAWQSLAYSPLGAAVSPPIASSSETNCASIWRTCKECTYYQ